MAGQVRQVFIFKGKNLHPLPYTGWIESQVRLHFLQLLFKIQQYPDSPQSSAESALSLTIFHPECTMPNHQERCPLPVDTKLTPKRNVTQLTLLICST
ncbi:MAG: hypothetical protein ACJARL_001066 [Halopseudomonas sp.]|jgi:hypothetical protein